MLEQSHHHEAARRELALELLHNRNRQNPLAVFFAVLLLAFAPVSQLAFGTASTLGPENFATKVARLQNVFITDDFLEDFRAVNGTICDVAGSPEGRMTEFYANQFAFVNPAVVVGATLLLNVVPEGTLSYETMGKVFYRSLPFRPDLPFGHCLDYSILG